MRASKFRLLRVSLDLGRKCRIAYVKVSAEYLAHKGPDARRGAGAAHQRAWRLRRMGTSEPCGPIRRLSDGLRYWGVSNKCLGHASRWHRHFQPQRRVLGLVDRLGRANKLSALKQDA